MTPVPPKVDDERVDEVFEYGPGAYEEGIEPVPEGMYEEPVPVNDRPE